MCRKSIDPIDLMRLRPLYEITATKRHQTNHNYKRQICPFSFRSEWKQLKCDSGAFFQYPLIDFYLLIDVVRDIILFNGRNDIQFKYQMVLKWLPDEITHFLFEI